MVPKLTEMSAKELVELYNRYSDSPIKKFESKETGIMRTRKLLRDAIPKDGEEFPPDVFVWCPALEKNIPLSHCEERQAKGERCKDHLGEDGRVERKCPFRKAKRSRRDPNKPPRVTKVGLIRKAFAEKKEHSIEDLQNITGYDIHNVRTAMNILRNPNRTKDPLVTFCEKGVYKLQESE